MTVRYQNKDNGNEPGRFKVRCIFYIALALGVLLAVMSFNSADMAVLCGGSKAPYSNWIGRSGAVFSAVVFHLFGLAAYLVVVLILLRALRSILGGRGRPWSSFGGAAMMVCGASLLLALAPEPFVPITDRLGLGHSGVPALALSGGAAGQVLAAPAVAEMELPEGVLRQLIGAVGVMILGWALLTGGGIIIYIADWHGYLRDKLFAGGDAVRCNSLSRRAERLERRRREAEDEEDIFDDMEEEPSKAPAAAAETEQSGEPEEKLSVAERAARFFGRINAEEEAERELAEREKSLAAAKKPSLPEVIEEDKDGEEPTPLLRPRNTAAAPKAAAGTLGGNQLSVEAAAAGDHRAAAHSRTYELPSIKMLAQGQDNGGEDREFIERSKEILKMTLESFSIDGEVTGHVTGPRVTRFEITLAPGINVKKVEQIAENIAMDLAAERVRVLAPIPGRRAVGIEVSNRNPGAVFMRSILESDAWQNGKSEIPIALGKDISGKPVVVDLAKAPHLLIAGATNTGKSVCTNSLIMSLLFHFPPDRLKLIMVDPKVVEYEAFKRLPHLLTPVINDSAKVPIALRWATMEMERRYRILARAGVKKLSEYNSRPIPSEPEYDDEGNELPAILPALVIIVDELADLMLTEAGRDIENSITRITAKGRAAGIHIVVATQRPDVKTITGKIKANLPTRFCFQVRSMQDSRVVLDTNGAEKLLGRGDMLFMSPSSMNIERVQGAFVPDDDIKAVVKFVCNQAEPSFDASVLLDPESMAKDEDEEDTFGSFGGRGGRRREDDGKFDPGLEDDPEFEHSDLSPVYQKYLRPGDDENVRRALEVVVLDHKCSTSYLQRRLGIGYNQAAKITDLFEARGIIGPASGSGNKREILIFDELGINGD